MILLLSSLASAATVEIGASGAYPTIFEAMPQVYVEGEVTEFILLDDYKATDEGPIAGLSMGLAFDTDVVIRSSVPGELRVSVPIRAYNGAEVRVVDLDLDASTSNYSNPLNTGSGSIDYVPALLATDGASLTAENVRIIGRTFTTTTGAVCALDANLTLINSELVGNSPGTGSSDPWEYRNYTVGFRADEGSSYALTLVDTVIENASGPALAIYADVGVQELNITGGLIQGVSSETAGSAIFASGSVDGSRRGTVDSTVTGLRIVGAGNTAVKLGDGSHNWTDIEIVDAEGAQGGAFHIADGGNLSLSEVQCTNCTGNDGGGAVFARSGTSVTIAGLSMIDGGGRETAAIHGEDVALSIKNSRFCGVSAENGPLISTSSQLFVRNSVFRNLPGVTPMFGGQGGDLEMVNNTFVNNTGPILGGVYTGLDFINNAVVSSGKLNAGEPPSDLRFGYNLFHDNLDEDIALSLSAGEGNLVNVDPGFVQAFTDAPDNCAVDPLPEAGSALIDAGDTAILDADGSRSDIGAFGGPGAEDSEITWDPTESGETILMGGCGSGGGAAALLLALPLLGLNRRRRRWAKEQKRV